MIDKITADTFRPFIGSAFTSETPQGRLSFTLDEVQYKERYNTGTFHHFTLSSPDRSLVTEEQTASKMI